ncbi:MAG: PilZ domain-containing protein, partial [Pseudomonadota bacterium]
DLGDISKINLDRRALKRISYWGAVLLTDKATHKSFRAHTRDLHKEGVGLAFTGEPPKVGDELILEFIGDEHLKPLSLEVKVTSAIKKSDEHFTFVGLKVIYAGSLATQRLEEYIKREE